MKSPYRLGVLLLISFIILIITVVSVQAATLNVTVTDARTDNRLNNVSITVTHEDGAVTQGVSSATGALEILDLATGVYTITASSPGYTEAVMTDVALADDETKSVEFALSSEVIQLEKVSVTASRRREKVLEAPASVALIGNSEIKDRVAPSVTEHLKSLRAVDVVTAGLGASYVVVRGFNNVFSFTKISLHKLFGIGAMLGILMSCGAVIRLLTIPTYMSGRFSTAIVLASGSVLLMAWMCC